MAPLLTLAQSSPSLVEAIKTILPYTALFGFICTLGTNIMNNLGVSDPEKRRIGWRQVALLISIILLIISGIVLVYFGTKWITTMWPMIIGISLFVYYNVLFVCYQRRVCKIEDAIKKNNNSVRIDEIKELRQDLDVIPQLIYDEIHKYAVIKDNDNLVSVDFSLPVGPRTPSGITLKNIIDDLSSIVQRSIVLEHGKAYRYNFILWTCRFHTFSCKDNFLTLNLSVDREMPIPKPTDRIKLLPMSLGPVICVTVPESENPKLKFLKKGSLLIVDGRICQLDVNPPMIVFIDNAKITPIEELPL
jgi:hypothetical protein